jgi:cytochrome c peroxidase
LRSDSGYVRAFSSSYKDGITRANVLNALTAFERSLVTPNCRFDRFQRGQLDALTQREIRGYQLFKRFGCITCHQGINIGGNLYQKFGVFEETAPGRNLDPGRIRMTKVPRDQGVFRVPSLRNVAVTAPYFHDGREPDLTKAVETMGKVQLGRALPGEQVGLIVEFLRTLTGEFRGAPLAAPPPEAIP